MKWNRVLPQPSPISRLGALLLAVALIAGPGLALPATALEPEPPAASTTAPAAPSTSAFPTGEEPAPPTSVPIETQAPLPAPESSVMTSGPDTTSTPRSDADRTSMAQAIGVGGAEMGQRSARVANSASASSKSLTTQALETQGTWSPTFGVQGLDVSGHQPAVDWQQQWNMGARFAYVKASEGNYYASETFSSQYEGSRNVGMIRGAYHFAIPNWSSGADQARYFVQNGGGWSADGYTLPPVLDFEFNPYAGRTINGFYFGNTCYGMSPSQLAGWVRDFGNTMMAMTGRLPVIYTNTSWWKQCTADAAGFGDYPLWVAAYPSSATNDAGAVPSSWDFYSMWQYSSTGPFAGDSNVWNGGYADLIAFAGNAVPDAASRGITDLRATMPAFGAQTSGIVCGLRDGGCYQGFQHGAIVWSPSTGAQPSPVGPIRTAWQQSGFENGVLGYPRSGIVCGLKDGGCYQSFQRGAIIWTAATGAQLSPNGPIRVSWEKSGFETGPMGYPTSGQVCGLANGGCYQNFQNGAILWAAASGAYLSINGSVRTAWQRSGFEAGPLGYPTSDTLCGLTSGGCFQRFQTGSIASTGTTGTYTVWGQMALAWQASGRELGPLGYPVAAEVCGLAGGGCYQSFERGATIWSPASGAHVSPNGPIRGAWQQVGFERGVLGYPTTSQMCGLVGGGCYQNFQGGAIIWSSATGAQVSASGAIRSAWRNSGFETGPLGYPTGAETCGLPEGGCYQNFQKGTITWAPARGALSVIGPIFTKWAGVKRESGTLGFPTSSQVCGLTAGGCYQNFQNGAILWSPGTGAQISPTGPIRTAWGLMGFERGSLGYPTGGVVCGLRDGGCYQNFQGGAFLWSPVTGAHPSVGQIRVRYASLGYENSFLGYPASGDNCTLENGGCYQNYQRGSITWYPAGGTSVSTAPR